MAARIEKLGERIQAIVRERGGYPATSTLLDITEGRLKSWTRGTSEPPLVFVRRLARLGNVSTDWLLSDAEDGWQEWHWTEARRGLDSLVHYLIAERRFGPPERKP